MSLQVVRMRVITIPRKLTADVRIRVDVKQAEYTSMLENGPSTSLILLPIMSLQIVRPMETNENGDRVRPPWNPNDSIGITGFTLPIFLRELKQIQEDMKIQELYTYDNEALILDSELADKVRRAFQIGKSTVELKPTILDHEGHIIEGIRMKFNNESSVVLLSLNDLYSLVEQMSRLDLNMLALYMYTMYVNRDRNSAKIGSSSASEFEVFT